MHREDAKVARFAQLAFSHDEPEELYDLRKDPEQIDNVVRNPSYKETLQQLQKKLTNELKNRDDPRVTGNGF